MDQEVEDRERGDRRQSAGDHETPDLDEEVGQARRHPCSLEKPLVDPGIQRAGSGRQVTPSSVDENTRARSGARA